MPYAANYKANASDPIKLLLIGDSGSGKTGSLASLAAAGYNLRVLDIDNGIPILLDYILNPKSPYRAKAPGIENRLHWITLTDPMTNTAGVLRPAQAKVWSSAMNALTHWRDGSIDLGKISTWTDKEVLVIDSLSMLSTAALNFCLATGGNLAKTRTSNESRRDIYQAQELLRSFLNLIFDSSVKCNVILTSHITFVSEVGGKPQTEDGEIKSSEVNGYPSAIGRALSPHIPRYFNTMLIAKVIGSGQGARHRIYTSSQNIGGQIINAKSQAPLSVKADYPLESGLADYFADVKGAK